MKPKSAKEQFLELVEPELRTHYSRIIDRVAPNEDDPIIAMFAMIGWSQRNGAESTQQRIAGFETLVSQVQTQLAVDNAKHLEAVRQVVGALSGKTLWRRIIASRIVGASLWTAMVVGLTIYLVDHQVRTVDPEFHAQIAAIDTKLAAQAEREEKTQGDLETGFATTAPVTTHTIVGEHLSTYITSVDPTGITITIEDPRKPGGLTALRVPHHMSPEEYNKLQRAYLVSKQFK